MKIEEASAAADLGAKRRSSSGERIVRKRGGFDRRTRRRVQAESSSIQGLFAICSAVFKGPGTVPPPRDVKMLQFFLGMGSSNS